MMGVSLNAQEVIKAIEVYMALKGFKTSISFDFVARRNEFQRVEFNIAPANFDIEKIKEYANK